MKLIRLSERVWYYPFEEERDRPNLGYIRGGKLSVAVDAGHSAAHVAEFYRALQEEGLPLPMLTVLTHWHWDHTFGMHAVNGLTVANRRTDAHLLEFHEKLENDGPAGFLDLHESIRNEYRGGLPVIVTPADIVFSGEMEIDAGNCPVRLTQTKSPHTDDAALVYIPGEKVLFLGDADCGPFPDGAKDPSLCEELIETVSALDADICLEGHRTPDTTRGIIEEIRSE